VPHYLRGVLDGTATGWLAEFRTAQIVFARFAGFQFHGEDDVPALAVLANGLRQAIDGNGGVRLKFGADDKGLILLAAGGLQSQSFEDDAERALTAAAMVQDAARLAGLAASIGVTGGKVFAGLVGSDRHREYTVIGDAMNRAAALSGWATGQTRVDGHTCDTGRKRYRFADAGIFTLKGQDAAPHYIMAAEALGQADQRGEMIGRMGERVQPDALAATLTPGNCPRPDPYPWRRGFG